MSGTTLTGEQSLGKTVVERDPVGQSGDGVVQRRRNRCIAGLGEGGSREVTLSYILTETDPAVAPAKDKIGAGYFDVDNSPVLATLAACPRALEAGALRGQLG